MVTDYTKILPHGKNNAILAANLAKIMGYKNTRKLRDDISASRAAGQVILSSTNGGYYLPSSREEIEEFISIMIKRIEHTFTCINSARKEMNKIDGQMELLPTEGPTVEKGNDL